ncbi:FecR domain-containing protein [Fibrella aquatilis]|uniref:FecR domain-containing protein n=1 Tax=Fibrella aquatilis TaxID=2817059 RepID=A0A939JYG1_9BACT|nr:FecR family protein [Fibrella aquatilis]MBO0929831.1 FecR domain-containing protein [Fibrella aquatilis]
MKPYAHYSAIELAMDDMFVRWVQMPDDDELSAHWQGFLEHQPQCEDLVYEARQLVKQISQPVATLPALHTDEVHSVWGRIRGSLQDLDDVRPLQPAVRSAVGWWYFGRAVAASLGMILLVGWTVFKQYTSETSRLITTTSAARQIELPDGSSVKLLPHSQLRYTPRGFARESAADGDDQAELTRAVWLTGAAEFKVVNPTGHGAANAFRVHTDNLTAEATGTHFSVDSQHGQTRVTLLDGTLNLLLGHRQLRHLNPGETVLVAGGDIGSD